MTKRPMTKADICNVRPLPPNIEEAILSEFIASLSDDERRRILDAQTPSDAATEQEAA